MVGWKEVGSVGGVVVTKVCPLHQIVAASGLKNRWQLVQCPYEQIQSSSNSTRQRGLFATFHGSFKNIIGRLEPIDMRT